MFSFRKLNADFDSDTTSRDSDLYVCFLNCKNKTLMNSVFAQLQGYQAIYAPRKIVLDKSDKNQPITKPLTSDNYPEYFYDVSIEKSSSFLGSAAYKIKITGSSLALQSAIEALVFAKLYDQIDFSLPPELSEYLNRLVQNEIPDLIKRAELNF